MEVSTVSNVSALLATSLNPSLIQSMISVSEYALGNGPAARVEPGREGYAGSSTADLTLLITSLTRTGIRTPYIVCRTGRLADQRMWRWAAAAALHHYFALSLLS